MAQSSHPHLLLLRHKYVVSRPPLCHLKNEHGHDNESVESICHSTSLQHLSKRATYQVHTSAPSPPIEEVEERKGAGGQDCSDLEPASHPGMMDAAVLGRPVRIAPIASKRLPIPQLQVKNNWPHRLRHRHDWCDHKHKEQRHEKQWQVEYPWKQARAYLFTLLRIREAKELVTGRADEEVDVGLHSQDHTCHHLLIPGIQRRRTLCLSRHLVQVCHKR
mmetsp:Transcript_17798/g.41490  ORF Transcript_17798/g.41490 Transcript_17798/m.41490 type:complete len:219 (-) Transcript_17798:476-1132(-)